MTRQECEEILKENGWVNRVIGLWCHPKKREDLCFLELGEGRVWLGSWPRLSYSSLTPDLFRELIGTKK